MLLNFPAIENVVIMSDYHEKGKRGDKLARLTGVLFLGFIIMIVLLGGCQAEKKPNIPVPDKTDQADRYDPSQLSASERRIISNRFSNIASTVKGVRRATVVLSSDNRDKIVVLVGLTLYPDAVDNKDQIKSRIAEKIKKNDKRVTQVLVTTDPDMTRRLTNVAAGILEGKPVNSYTRTIDELRRTLKE
ncbi:MAG: YhcN/YlaJ family sporulation lipoprotein [Syntrophomonadaceae bacterium]